MRSLPSTRMRRCAACEVWRNSETSLKACERCTRPSPSRDCISSGGTPMQMLGAVLVHQEADGATVHAIDRLAGAHEAMQGLQHEAVAAERHDHVGSLGRGVAVVLAQPRAGLLGFGIEACHEGYVLVARVRTHRAALSV